MADLSSALTNPICTLVFCVMQSEMCLVQTTVKSTQFHKDLLLSPIQILLNPGVSITWTGKFKKITESIMKSWRAQVAEAGKAFHMPQRIHFILSLSLLYPANNYTIWSTRVYEYEFIISELHYMSKYWIGLGKRFPWKTKIKEQHWSAVFWDVIPKANSAWGFKGLLILHFHKRQVLEKHTWWHSAIQFQRSWQDCCTLYRNLY